jgi:hypothetical protein
MLLPGALNIIADFFSRRQDVDVIYGNRILIDEQGMAIGRWLLPQHSWSVYAWVDLFHRKQCVGDAVSGIEQVGEWMNLYSLQWIGNLYQDSIGARRTENCNGLIKCNTS